MVTTVTMTRDPGTYSTETPPLPTKAKFATSRLSYHQNYHLSKFWQYWYIFCQYWFWYDDRVARRRSVKTSYSVKSYRWCQFLQFSFQHSQTKPHLRGKNKQRLHKIRYFSSFPTSMISQRDRREFGRNIFKTFLGSPTSCGFRSNPPKTCLASYPKTSPKTRMKTERGRKVWRKKAFYGLAPTAALIGRTRNAERPLLPLPTASSLSTTRSQVGEDETEIGSKTETCQFWPFNKSGIKSSLWRRCNLRFCCMSHFLAISYLKYSAVKANSGSI